MSFDLEDEIDDNKTITTTTVTLRWREGTTVNDSRAAPFIGYNILVGDVTQYNTNLMDKHYLPSDTRPVAGGDGDRTGA